MGAAARFQSVQREALRGRTQQAVTRIRMAFYDLLLGQEEVRLTENSLKRVRQSLEETRAMQEAGLSPAYDVLRLEVELANLDVDEAEVADFVRRSAAGRSDLRQLRMTRDLRHAELRIEQVEYLPKVFVFGTYGLAARQNGTPDFFGSSQQRGSSKQVGLRVTVPVFSGFGRDARIDQKQAVLRQAETETRVAADRAEVQLRNRVGAMVSPGTAVARIVQADTIRIMAGVPERYALYVSAGADASVSFDVLPGEDFAGSMTYVGAVVDLDARTFPIELTLPNPGMQIKPGMVAEVSVTQGEVADAIVVPRQALVSMEEGQVVFVAEEAGGGTAAAARRVVVPASQGNDVVIESGLVPGDRLVVVGQQGLTDGDRVRVVTGEGGAREQ